MMSREKINERIDRAKWLLSNVKHAAMATVNDDGTPHNTPYFFMISNDLSEIYWGSHPDSMHSKNVLRNGNLFVVLYEANERGGLYIECKNGRIAEGDELKRALARHNELRKKHGSEPLPTEYYEGSSEQRMWLADTTNLWVNYTDRDSQGRIKQDRRELVSKLDLNII